MLKKNANDSFYWGLIIGIVGGSFFMFMLGTSIRLGTDTYYRDLIVNNPEAIAAIRSSELAKREEARLLESED